MVTGRLKEIQVNKKS